MVIRGLLEQATVGLEPGDDVLVGVENVLTLELADDRVELATLVDRNINRNSGRFTNSLVIFTVGRRLVNDSGSIALANVVVD